MNLCLKLKNSFEIAWNWWMASAISHSLHLTLDIWPWDYPDLDLQMTFKKFKVKRQLKINVEVTWSYYKIIVVLYRHLTLHGLDLYPGHLTLRLSWPRPLNDLQKILGQRSPQGQMSRSRGHYITRSQAYCITLQISYCSWPWPLPLTFDLEMILALTSEWPSQNSRSKVTSRSNVEVTKSIHHKVTRSLYYSTDILLFMVLTLTLYIWPWDDPDLDLKLTFTKLQV